MTEQLKILKSPKDFQISIGEKTDDLISRLSNLNDEEKRVLVEEAGEILSNCINPANSIGGVTGLAVGYVQSGKTMSFTTLTTLALDNGFRIIIYLAGIKKNLLDQTTERLRKDLLVSTINRKNYKIYKNPKNEPGNIHELSNGLKLRKKPGILITVLKIEQHIREVTQLLTSVEIKAELGNNGILIIDDEADQASLNTYARSNSKSEDWEPDEFSSTYSSILDLKNSLPNHSFIQYTATPQGPLLINLMDLLSPEFHVVLTPGKQYTGGKTFFEDNPDLVITIPPSEVYHNKHNPLSEPPESLINALQIYLIGVAVQVNLLENVDFLSMMIHSDKENIVSEKFFTWVNRIISGWGDVLDLENENDPMKQDLIGEFKRNYDEAVRRIDHPPRFEEVLTEIREVILDTNIHLVIAGVQEIEWHCSTSHILIGAEMLNRGFTVEGLAVTYMPRNSVSKSNADTIQQRCRFYGYKAKYLDSCRVYLPQDSILEYKEYNEHEEIMRKHLKSSTLRDTVQVLILDKRLNPTRSNILSQNVVRHKLSGWRQMNALSHIRDNTEFIESFIQANAFELYKDFGTETRNHRILKMPINRIIEFLKEFKVSGVPDAIRKSSTIQYLRFLADNSDIEYAYIFEMAYALKEGRERKLNGSSIVDFKINNIFMGESNDGGMSYPGDRGIKIENSFCIQIHKIKLKHKQSLTWNQKELYTLGLYYPENLSHSMVGMLNIDE